MLSASLRRLLVTLFLCLAGCVFVRLSLSSVYRYPFPAARLTTLSEYVPFDMGGIIAGARRLAADIAWIQLLQYYGSPEKQLDQDTQFKLSWDMTRYLFGIGLEKEVCHKEGCHEAGHYHQSIEGGVYPDFLAHCYRVVGLDPFFSYAYLYGGGALAWNLDRPEEALALLRHGLDVMERYQPSITRDAHQPYWQFQLYISAIVYRKMGQESEMISLLETAVHQPGCPNMIRAILANIYQKQGNLSRALALWLAVYDTGDPTYQARAAAKIDELRKFLRL